MEFQQGGLIVLLKLLQNSKKNVPFHIVYIGNIGIAQEFDTLLDAVGGNDDFQVTLVGGGNDSERIHRRIQSEGLSNIHLTGPLAWENTIQYVESSDCLYGQIGAAYTTAVPSKIFEYASSARPVIFAAPTGPAREIIDSLRGVYALPPNDSQALRNKLNEIRADEILPSSVVDYNRNLIACQYLRETEGLKFASLVVEVYSGGYQDIHG